MTSKNPTESFVYITLPGARTAITAGKFVLEQTPTGDPIGRFVYGRSYLAHPDAQLRLSALRVISKYADEGAFEVLSSATKDNQADIRKEALNILCHIYGQRAFPVLIHLLHDLDDDVRKAAISLCSAFEARQAVPVLITMLADDNAMIVQDVKAALLKITKETTDKTAEEWNLWWMDQYGKS